MKYKQLGYGMLLALALVPGITLGGCAQHLSSMTALAKGEPVASAAGNIGLRVIRRLGPGERPAVDLILTILRYQDTAGKPAGKKLRLRVKTEEGDPITERLVPYGSTIEVLNLPFQQWGKRICVFIAANPFG